MTREEAANILDLKTRPEALADFVGPELAGIVHQAMIMGAEALRGPQPDPETGLVPCGCGGEPKMLDIKRPYADKGFWVECQGCGITIGPCDSPTIAIIAFNQAMGVKGADE